MEPSVADILRSASRNWADLPADAHGMAAERARRAVMPPGGRKEGAATGLLNAIGEIPGQMVGSFKNMMDAAYSHPPGMSVRDNPQLAGLVAENALNVVGAPAMGGGMPGLGSGVSKGIKAYHGSPHDFDRFDMSKIGTGEGAQAYGHGLYFAENPKVAQGYREALSGPPMNLAGAESIADSFLRATAGDRDAAIALLRERNAGRTPHLEALALLEGGWKPNAGRMYEVNIRARPEEFLDWDKPVLATTRNPDVREIARRTLEQSGRSGDVHPPMTGSVLYNALALSPQNPAGGAARMTNYATDALREAGIPGIKYLDQGSRTAGQGTRNYVLFRDDIIDILKKYAAPFMVGGGVVSGSIPTDAP